VIYSVVCTFTGYHWWYNGSYNNFQEALACANSLNRDRIAIIINIFDIFPHNLILEELTVVWTSWASWKREENETHDWMKEGF